MKLVQDTIPTMKKLIQNNNFDTAVNLIRESEEIYVARLKPIVAIKLNFYDELIIILSFSFRNCHVNFKNGRETLENSFKKEFHDRCLAYMTKTLAYSKLSNQNLEGSSILDESILVFDIKSMY